MKKKPPKKPAEQKKASAKATPLPKAESPQPNRPAAPDHFLIVGVGASAGGLEALEQFFSTMPPAPGFAIVLLPHLEPSRPTLMPDLIQKVTPMKVHLAEEGMQVVPNEVYVIPPDRTMSIEDTKLRLVKTVEKHGPRMPINHFLTSLAIAQKEYAAAVILSGMGSDGTEGLREIKVQLGLVLVQDPKTAKFDGMPESAIKTRVADEILIPQEMSAHLLEYARRLARHGGEEQSAPPGDELQGIITLLRSGTGHDFSGYKRNTLLRRTERRMHSLGIKSLSAYRKHLRQNPEESQKLFSEILIGVTSFFREPDAFETIRDIVLPRLLNDKPDDYQLRIWVAGCSTGEEAYSLAIVVREFMDAKKKDFDVRIFATDIDPAAIEIARIGAYPHEIAADITEERLRKCFLKENNAYRVRRDLREMVIFAVQDVIKDPPFTHIDLVSCRNLLIYLETDLQKRLLPIFHYSLRLNGVLFLGSSETVGSQGYLFSALDKKFKIFARKDTVAVQPVEFPLTKPAAGDGKIAFKKRPATDLQQLIERKLVARYAPPSVVVDEKGDIIFVHGRTGSYLEPAPGKAVLNIVEMAREGLRLHLPAALRKAVAKKHDVVLENLQVKTNGSYEFVNVTVKPLAEPESMKGLLMVIFEEGRQKKELPPPQKTSERKPAGTDRRIADLEKELGETKSNLQSTIEELESANEELKSANEEYQSTNEELQSTNEEMETSKEELQSLNEELVTVNSELQGKFEELSRATADMKSFLDGLEVPTVFLDCDLRIRRFTIQAPAIINLIETDIGRPLSHLITNLKNDILIADAQRVLQTTKYVEREVETKDGRWFLMRIIPYKTGDNVFDGVVITFVDISDLKSAIGKLHVTEEDRALTRSIVETVRESLLLLDESLQVILANESFYRTFHTSSIETLGKYLYEMGDRQWDIPELRELLELILPNREKMDDFVVEREFPRIGKRKMILNARRLVQERSGKQMILLAIEDMTGK